MGESITNEPRNLGFLTILNDPGGYVGGYLVLNAWGRPIEFRMSTAVQPNRVQQVLYAGTMQPYLFADLIGKALVDKAATKVSLLLTDCEPVLDLRRFTDFPVVWISPADDALAMTMAGAGGEVRPSGGGCGPIVCHPRNSSDAPSAREVLRELDSNMDLKEPFVRIREAVTEARKMGVRKSA